MGGSLRDAVAGEVSIGGLGHFLKRKVPALGSLLIGVLVGLLLAQALSNRDVSLPPLLLPPPSQSARAREAWARAKRLVYSNR